MKTLSRRWGSLCKSRETQTNTSHSERISGYRLRSDFIRHYRWRNVYYIYCMTVTSSSLSWLVEQHSENADIFYNHAVMMHHSACLRPPRKIPLPSLMWLLQYCLWPYHHQWTWQVMLFRNVTFDVMYKSSSDGSEGTEIFTGSTLLKSSGSSLKRAALFDVLT